MLLEERLGTLRMKKYYLRLLLIVSMHWWRIKDTLWKSGKLKKGMSLRDIRLESLLKLLGKLKNETMNIIRKRKKVVHVENADYFDHKDEAYDIEEEYLEVLNKEKLLTCINRLSDEDKTLIHLRFANEVGFKHIAGLLGITEEAAKKRGQRILKKLRQFYEGGDEDAKNS